MARTVYCWIHLEKNVNELVIEECSLWTQVENFDHCLKEKQPVYSAGSSGPIHGCTNTLGLKKQMKICRYLISASGINLCVFSDKDLNP